MRQAFINPMNAVDKSRLFLKPKVHYRIHKSPSLIRSLSRMDQIYNLVTYILRPILISFFLMCLRFSSVVSHRQNTLYMAHASNVSSFERSNVIWRKIQIMKLFMEEFPTYLSLGSHIVDTLYLFFCPSQAPCETSGALVSGEGVRCASIHLTEASLHPEAVPAPQHPLPLPVASPL
jgi:hypothetical protein